MDAIAEYLKTCEDAVRAGAAQLRKWFGRVDAEQKGPANLVTQADYAAQAAIRQVIRAAFPEHGFLAEEHIAEEDLPAPARQTAANSRFRWIVDPLDGTTNYVHQVPHFAVSVALEEAGRLLAAAVYDPNREECFTAAAGRGAWLGGQRISVSQVADLGDALAAVGFPAEVRPECPDLRVFLAMVTRCQSMRRTGSAALNLCYVAAGRFDLAWSFSTSPWDAAAGALLVAEAGGRVQSPDGGEFDLQRGCFLAAASGPLMDQAQALFRAALAGG